MDGLKQPKKKTAPPHHAERGFFQQNGREIVRRVEALAEPLCHAENMELIHMEYHAEARGKVLRLYIDKPGGVSLDDCAAISRQVSDLLDFTLGDLGNYHLEVSSPGVERPVSRMKDFIKYTGRGIRVRTSEPVAGRKNFTGRLEAVEDGIVHLLADGERFPVPFSLIAKARLVPDDTAAGIGSTSNNGDS